MIRSSFDQKTFESFDISTLSNQLKEAEDITFIPPSSKEATVAIKGSSVFGLDIVPALWGDIIAELKDGCNVEFFAATGHGKTTLGKIAALNFEGSCLVVTPSIALARTQIADLVARGVTAALWGHSTFTFSNLPKFVYITPEAVCHGWARLLPLYKQFSLLMIDELSLIYSNKHFRRAFKVLGALRTALGVPCYLCSIHISKKKLAYIERVLNFKDPKKLKRHEQGPVLRHNAIISFNQYPSKQILRSEGLLPFIKCHKHNAGIVYVRTRKEVETVASYLNKNLPGVKVLKYHAKLKDEERQAVEIAFMTGRSILVSTSACAYGINNPLISWVAFYGLPYNLIDYQQMAGRAGREKGSLAFVWCGYTSWEEEAFRRKSARAYRSKKQAFYQTEYEELLNIVHEATCRRVAITRAIKGKSVKPCGVCDVCRADHKAAKVRFLLEKLRKKIAIATKTPPQLVFSESVLDTLADIPQADGTQRGRPQTIEELISIKGLGPAKVARYGELILELTNNHAL